MGTVRQIVFGILPDGQSHATYSWPMIEDGNLDGKLIMCAHCPTEKSNVFRSSQDQIFLGTKEVDYCIRTFANEYGYDGYDPISAEFITNRIDPSMLVEDGVADAKRFLRITFFDTNPFELGVDLTYSRDIEDPLVDAVVWEDVYWATGKSRATIPHGLARWVHFKGVDNSVKVNKPSFGAFLLSFYRLYNRDKEGLE